MADEAFDRACMEEALAQARLAEAAGEVPVGAVVACAGRIVARAYNSPVGRRDPTAHAEVLALRAAGEALGAPRLPGATLYVTLEPCLMCLGAAVHARLERVVFAADDPLVGATALFADVPVGRPGLNHRVIVERGPGGEAAADLLRFFFRARRRA